VIALLEATPEGLRMIGTPGWRMSEAMGVLIQMGGRQVFQYKQEIVEATPERLETVRRYLEHLDRVIGASPFDVEDKRMARQEDRQGIGLSRRQSDAT